MVLIRDFNADPLKYDSDSDTSDLLYLMFLNTLLPHIIDPILLTLTSHSLIDNIFIILLWLVLSSWNKSTQNKEMVYFWDFTEMEKPKDLISTQLANVNWEEELRIEENNVGKSTNLLYNKIENLIKLWASLQKMLKSKRKTQNGPRIKDIVKCILIKIKFFWKMCITNDLKKKGESRKKSETLQN